MAKMTLLSLSLFLSCFSFFSYWCPRVGRNQWPWFIAAIYIKIPTLKLGEPPVDSWLHYRLRKERGAVVARNGLVYADARRLNPSFDVSPSSLLSPEWIVGVACASDPRPFPDIRDPVEWIFVTGWPILSMKVTWTRPYVVDITSNFLQFVLYYLLKYRLIPTIHHLTQLVGSYFLNEDHARRRWNQSLYLRNLIRFYILRLSLYIYIFQTIATSIQKYNLSNNQKKIIFTRAIIFSQLSIYLSICSKTKLFEFFERMQRLSARSSTSNIRSKRRSISSKDEKAGRTRTMSLEGNRRAFPIPPRRLQDSDLTVVTCSISAIVCRS